jgi:hypothetical protein
VTNYWAFEVDSIVDRNGDMRYVFVDRDLS